MDSLFAPQREYKVETAGDEFEGSRTIRLGNDLGDRQDGRRQYLEAVVLEEKSGRKSLWLAFTYVGTDWVFISAGPSLDFLLDDGTRITFSGDGSGSSAANRDVFSSGRINERAVWLVAPQQFKQIVNSRSAKMRVRGDKSSPVCEVPKETLANFRRFYEEQVYPVVPHLPL